MWLYDYNVVRYLIHIRNLFKNKYTLFLPDGNVVYILQRKYNFFIENFYVGLLLVCYVRFFLFFW